MSYNKCQLWDVHSYLPFKWFLSNFLWFSKSKQVQCSWLSLFWILQPFETVFQSISGRLPERGRKRRERIEESKNVQTTRTHCKHSRPLPYYHPNCRTPRHWKITQGHRTTRPPTSSVQKSASVACMCDKVMLVFSYY